MAVAVLPRIAPTIPALVEPFHRPGWVYEEKVDGWRIIAYKRDFDVQLVSPTGRNLTRRFPDVALALAKLSPSTLILDGELAVFDEGLVSRLDLLHGSTPDVVTTPPMFLAFDCLYVDGIDLRPALLRERRTILEQVVAGELVLPVRRLPPDGAEAWAEVQRRGYEGLVAKDDAAPYRGGPSKTWLKVKVRHEKGRPDPGLTSGERSERRRLR